jgi:hypothetical protein
LCPRTFRKEERDGKWRKRCDSRTRERRVERKCGYFEGDGKEKGMEDRRKQSFTLTPRILVLRYRLASLPSSKHYGFLIDLRFNSLTILKILHVNFSKCRPLNSGFVERDAQEFAYFQQRFFKH